MIDWTVLFGLFCVGAACCTVGGARVLYWYRHEHLSKPSACAGSQSGASGRRERSAAAKLTPELRQQLEAAFLAQEAAAGTTAGANTPAVGATPALDLPPGVTLNDVLFPPFTFGERLRLRLGMERDRELSRRYHYATWLARQILASCQASRLHTPGRPNVLPEITVFVPDGPEGADLDYTFCLEPPVGVRVTRFNAEFLADLNTRLGGMQAALTFRAPGVWLAVPQERVTARPAACTLADLGAPPESYRLPLPLGRSTRGPLWADLATAPHALVAGATGSGKSTLIHACLHLLLGRAEVWGLDLKMVELSRYKRRMARLVTEPDAVTGLLAALFQETRRRLAAMQQQGYNTWRGTPIVLVVDELAEVTLASKDDTQILLRLAQIGRAAGVHLLLATQRPSVQIIPGDLKANLPLRVALALPTGVDSRVVLDAEGAETLSPPGDALVLQGHKITRVSTPYFRAPVPLLDLDGEDDPRLVGLSDDARAVFVRMQEAGCRGQDAGGRGQEAGGRMTVRAVKAKMHWGTDRARRALRELSIAGLLGADADLEEQIDGGMDVEETTTADAALYPPMLPVAPEFGSASTVSPVSVPGVPDVLGSKNREQNGQGVQNADAAADADAVSDAVRSALSDLNRDMEDLHVARRAIETGACAASLRGMQRYFHWGQARATRVLRALRAGGSPALSNVIPKPRSSITRNQIVIEGAEESVAHEIPHSATLRSE